MWSRTTTETEKKELERLSSLKGAPVDYSDPDAPRTDKTRKIYREKPPFVNNSTAKERQSAAANR
jgi:hypothetical protein